MEGVGHFHEGSWNLLKLNMLLHTDWVKCVGKRLSENQGPTSNQSGSLNALLKDAVSTENGLKSRIQSGGRKRNQPGWSSEEGLQYWLTKVQFFCGRERRQLADSTISTPEKRLFEATSINSSLIWTMVLTMHRIQHYSWYSWRTF